MNNRKSLQDLQHTSGPLTPEETTFLKKKNKKTTLVSVLSFVASLYFLGMAIVDMMANGVIAVATSDFGIMHLIGILVTFVVGVFAGMRGQQIRRDIHSQVKIIAYSTLYRKDEEKEKNRVEYELHFEGLRDDVEVSKGLFLRMEQGKQYELTLAQYSKQVFYIRDIETKEVYYNALSKIK